jgi:hypothetical protein
MVVGVLIGRRSFGGVMRASKFAAGVFPFGTRDLGSLVFSFEELNVIFDTTS